MLNKERKHVGIFFFFLHEELRRAESLPMRCVSLVHVYETVPLKMMGISMNWNIDPRLG